MPTARVLSIGGPAPYVRGFTAAGIRVDRLAEPCSTLLDTWQAAREVGDSVRDVRADQTARALARGAYDAVIAHSVLDLAAAPGDGAPRVLLLHTKPELLDLYGDGPASWDDETRRAVSAAAAVVFSADDTARAWNLDGPIVPPAVRVEEWSPSTHGSREAVTVAPFAAERALLDTAYLVAVLTQAPGLTVLGTNPGLSVETNTASRPERQRAFHRARAYVNLSHPRYEPAAPLAMLEAMASGLPVVTLAHEISPIVHGVNGLVACSADELAAATQRLLDDEALAARLGSAARTTVAERYSQESFTTRWSSLLASLPRSRRKTA